MKKTKLEKGITLVALIITIVVLLILAVVSIGTVKNSGIIGHATNASDAWKKEQENEKIDLKSYENFLEKNNTIKKPETTTETRYYKQENVIQQFEITGNVGVSVIYDINDSDVNYISGPTSFLIKSVENPITMSLWGGGTQDITTNDKQLEINENIMAYVKENYLYVLTDNGKYTPYTLVTDTSEISEIETKIASIKN